jgi:hypothetical protein
MKELNPIIRKAICETLRHLYFLKKGSKKQRLVAVQAIHHLLLPDDSSAPARTGKATARSGKAAAAHQPAQQGQDRLYTLEVFLLSGPITEKFASKNPVVSRTIRIRGDQTLEDLHHAVFDAFGRWEEHMHEFQFGKGPMDPKARRYVLPSAFEGQGGEDNPPAGRVDTTTIGSLGLKVGDRFGYWFDFGAASQVAMRRVGHGPGCSCRSVEKNLPASRRVVFGGVGRHFGGSPSGGFVFAVVAPGGGS